MSVFENYSYSYAISDGPGAGVDGRLLLPAIEALQIKYAASVPAFLKNKYCCAKQQQLQAYLGYEPSRS